MSQREKLIKRLLSCYRREIPMIDIMEHWGWVGSIEVSPTDGVLHGKLLNTEDLVSYEGETVVDLIKDFHETVEEYVDFCLRNSKPAQPRDEANIFTKIELFRELTETAKQKNMSVESCIEESLLRGMTQLKAS